MINNILIGGYGSPIADWHLFDKHISNGDNYEQTWEWIWAELHHQGDIGSASFYAAIKLLNIYSQRGIASGDLLWFLTALNDKMIIHDDIFRYIDEYGKLKMVYLHWCLDNLMKFKDTESTKGLLIVIAQESGNNQLASALDIMEISKG